jgi:ribosome-binding protein aMBF1 (putative translation factor)
VDCVHVCSDCVDRVGREVDAAWILNAVEKHRLVKNQRTDSTRNNGSIMKSSPWRLKFVLR